MSFVTNLPQIRQSLFQESNDYQGINQKSNVTPKNYRENLDTSQSLNLAKKQKKDAQNEAQIIANRIALLRQLELKTWKAAQENQKKAMDIYEYKLNQQQFLIEKEQARIKQLKQLDLVKQKKEIDNQLKQMKKEDWKQLQLEQKQFMNNYFENQKQLLNSNKSINKQKNQQLYQKIKEEEEKKRIALQQHELLKQQKVKDYKLIQAQQDKAQAQQIKMEIEKMHHLEQQLMERLEHSQQLKQFSYQKLAQAQNLETNQFQKKYLKFDLQTNNGSKESIHDFNKVLNQVA